METWETQDMTLAVYLRMNGHKSKTQWRDGTFFWQFNDSQNLREEVTTYAQGAALVEPRLFSRMFATCKREMWTAPGSPRRNRGFGLEQQGLVMKINTD